MCLVLFAHRVWPGRPFVLAANRDEALARPSAPAAWWSVDGIDIFGGRDLEKGGTWLGVTRAGRIAAVTNVRDGAPAAPAGLASRGRLVVEALTEPALPASARFPAHNLLVGELGGALHYARDGAQPVPIAPGVHGLSNARLDSPWPKVVRGVRALEALGERGDFDALFAILRDDGRAPDDALPSTGVPLELERALSPAFIRIPAIAYGTRCSTVITRDEHGVIDFEERRYDASGEVGGTSRERISPT